MVDGELKNILGDLSLSKYFVLIMRWANVKSTCDT